MSPAPARKRTGHAPLTMPTADQVAWKRLQMAKYTPEYCGSLLEADPRSLGKFLRWVGWGRKR